MKKILVLLLLFPLFVFSQSERSQKQIYRGGGTPNNGYYPRSSPSYTQPPRFTPTPRDYSEPQRKYQYREQNSLNRRSPGRLGPIYGGVLPYFGYYPTWDEWSFHSPWANRYSFWRPYYWYDPFGYRQFGRIYYYDDDIKQDPDTVRVQRPGFSIGVQYSKDELGGFVTVGNKVYFIAEYQTTYQKDKSIYYEDITMDNVIPWQDKKLEDVKRTNTIYVGLGKRIGRFGVHGELGFCREENRYQYLDELYILSNNGRYSFPNYKDDFICAKLGALYDFNLVTGKVDYDPVRNAFTFGLGINF